MASLAAAGAVILTPLSQSSLLSLPKPPLPAISLRRLSLTPLRFSSSSHLSSRIVAAAAGEKAREDTALDIEIGGGEGGSDKGRFGGGSGGGGGEGSSGEGEGEEKEKKMSGMSMSQKLTLGYAALIGGKLTVSL